MVSIKKKTFEVKCNKQECYEENLKTTFGNMKCLSHQRELPCSWITKHHLVKMFISPKSLYKRREVLIKVLADSFFRGMAKCTLLYSTQMRF